MLWNRAAQAAFTPARGGGRMSRRINYYDANGRLTGYSQPPSAWPAILLIVGLFMALKSCGACAAPAAPTRPAHTMRIHP